MIEQSIKKNDKTAKILIGVFSSVVFTVVVLLSKFKLDINLGFDIHIFATINALLNSIIAVLLILALTAVKKKNFLLHRSFMIAALILSILFLVSYITHHLLAGDTVFGDLNHDGHLDDSEKVKAGSLRIIYYIILATHIFLAAIILPFILFSAYLGLSAQFPLHKKLARITFPLWLYVAITGPLVYWFISPYYY